MVASGNQIDLVLADNEIGGGSGGAVAAIRLYNGAHAVLLRNDVYGGDSQIGSTSCMYNSSGVVDLAI